MSTPEFTDDELATLRRFDEAPFAPEARYRDMNPLVPDGEIRPAWEVAPCPESSAGAAEWSRHYLAEAWANHGLAHDVMRRCGNFRDADPDLVQEMATAYEHLAESFSLGFLFRHVTDEVSRQLADILEMGETDELTWDWLRKAGTNPHHIRSSPTRAEEIAARSRLRAEREAQGEP